MNASEPRNEVDPPSLFSVGLAQFCAFRCHDPAMLYLMSEEPTTTPINEDDNAPATKAFVRSQVKGLRKDRITEIEGVETRIDRRFTTMQKDITETKTTMKRVLKVVESIDEHFNAHKDLPQKVADNASEIHKLKMKA
jgi:hypothetical protein